jgi:putative Holliday junction resolvase
VSSTGAPAPVRLLAVDYGDARTGLAATDFTGTIVVPLPPVHERDRSVVAAAVAAVARDRASQAIVVGMPLDLEGRAGKRARATLGFVQALAPLAPCPVHTIDESGTTGEAHDLLRDAGLKAARRKRLADSVAAMVILERFRHELRGPRASPGSSPEAGD